MRKKYNLKCSRIIVSVAIVATFLATSLFAEVNVKEYTFRGGNESDRAEYFAQIKDVQLWGSGKYPEDTSFMGKMFKMSTANIKFVLWCPGRIDPVTNEWRSAVGMVKPSKANWYTNSFYNVRISGKNGSDYKTVIEEVKGGEDKGVVKINWHHPDALVTVKFILLDGDDKLLAETKIQPKTDIKGYQIYLVCYPSSMAGGWKPGLKIRDREALTNKRIIKRPKKEDNKGYISVMLEKDEPWVLFYDKYFDVANNRGEGPCAVLYSPKEVNKVKLTVENYSCEIFLDYPASTISHLMLWDFHGMTNQAAAEYMRNLEIK